MFENYPSAFCVAVFIFSPPPFVPPPKRGILVGGFVVTFAVCNCTHPLLFPRLSGGFVLAGLFPPPRGICRITTPLPLAGGLRGVVFSCALRGGFGLRSYKKRAQKNAQPLAGKLMNQMRRIVSAEAVGSRLDRFRHCFISAGRTEAPFILKSFLFKGP